MELLLWVGLPVAGLVVWGAVGVIKYQTFRTLILEETVKVFYVLAAGALVAILANYLLPAAVLRYQSQYEINKNILDSENTSSQQALVLINAAYYSMLRVIGDIKRSDNQDLQSSWGEYEDALVKWNINRVGVVSQISIQFGFPLADEIQTDAKDSSVKNPVAIQDQLTNADYDLRMLKTCFENDCPAIQMYLGAVASSSGVLGTHINKFEVELTQVLAARERSIVNNPFGMEDATTTP